MEPVANSTHQSPVSEDVAGESTEDQPITMKDVSKEEEEEESTTVGAGVTSLDDKPVALTPTEDKELEPRKLVAIPEAEETLEVGTEMGKTMLCLCVCVCVCAVNVWLHYSGKLDVKLHVIPEEGSGVTVPNPPDNQGEEPQKEVPPIEVEREEPATEEVHAEDSEKMDLSETSQVEDTEEAGEQVLHYHMVHTGSCQVQFHSRVQKTIRVAVLAV